MDGQPFWDEAQSSFFGIPSVNKIVEALEKAYHADRGKSQTAIDFASQFDVDLIWQEKWVPFFTKLFA